MDLGIVCEFIWSCGPDQMENSKEQEGERGWPQVKTWEHQHLKDGQ